MTDIDEEEYERRKSICHMELNNLETQFEWLKEKFVLNLIILLLLYPNTMYSS